MSMHPDFERSCYSPKQVLRGRLERERVHQPTCDDRQKDKRTEEENEAFDAFLRAVF